MRKNAEIEIYRFIMIMGVALLHITEDYSFQIFMGGYLGVDFCFMLAGFFLMMHYYRNFDSQKSAIENSLDYIIGRVKNLYFPYIIAILIMTLVKWLSYGGTPIDLYLLLYSNRWQFLMLHSIGAPTVCIIRSVWFLSPLIFLSFFIYFCLCYNKKLFVGLSPFLSLLVFVYIAQEYGFMGMHFVYDEVLGGGIIRGFPEMLLGVFLAYLVQEYSKAKDVRIGMAKGVVIRSICYIVIIYTILKCQWDFNDFNVFPAFAVLIYIAFVHPIKIINEKVECFIVYLGGLSYWIYLVHNIVGYAMYHYSPQLGPELVLPIYFGITILLSVILRFVFEKSKIFIKNLKFS